MASSTRIELATYCLGGNCSILLSYEDTNKLYHITTKNRIKKFLTYIVCIVSLISLYACNNINSLDDSEFIIIDNNNIYGIEKKDNKFVVNSSQKREKGDFELWYYNNILGHYCHDRSL